MKSKKSPSELKTQWPLAGQKNTISDQNLLTYKVGGEKKIDVMGYVLSVTFSMIFCGVFTIIPNLFIILKVILEYLLFFVGKIFD